MKIGFQSFKYKIALVALALSQVIVPAFSRADGIGRGFSSAHLSQHQARIRQVQAFNFDFDDNLFVTDAKIMLWDTIQQKEVGISTADWALARDRIGKEGPWENLAIRDDSFRQFGDDTEEGMHLFRHQVEEALEKPQESWKGPSWDAFVDALGSPKTRKATTIITARRHSPDAILEGLALLKERGLIPALPPKQNIFVVGWPGLPEQFRGKDTAESKAKVMEWILDRVEATPIPHDAAWVENREGTGKERLHLWGFSDDDFGNYSTAISVLSKEVARRDGEFPAGRWSHVKIVIFFTGLNHPTETPHSVVIRPDGTIRPTLPMEATLSNPVELDDLMSTAIFGNGVALPRSDISTRESFNERVPFGSLLPDSVNVKTVHSAS